MVKNLYLKLGINICKNRNAFRVFWTKKNPSNPQCFLDRLTDGLFLPNRKTIRLNVLTKKCCVEKNNLIWFFVSVAGILVCIVRE